jgi:hypothetical protein
MLARAATAGGQRIARGTWIREVRLWVRQVHAHAQFSLAPALPSITSAALPSTEPRALFGDFIGTTAKSDSSKTCTRAVRLLPSPAGLSRMFAPGISEVSRFSCMEFPDVHGV